MASQDAGLFSEDLVFFDLEATDRHELFAELGSRLEARGLIKPSWYEAIEKREDSYATGLHFDHIDVAIPHVDPAHLTRPYIAVVRPVHPIEFEHMAAAGPNAQAELVVNLGVERDGGQVAVLQTLMNIFMDQKKAERVLAQDTAAGMVDTFTALFSEGECS